MDGSWEGMGQEWSTVVNWQGTEKGNQGLLTYLPTYLHTHSSQHSPSSEANRFCS